jgi:lipopolysaccharide transport system ATP-binding protein
MSDWAIKVEDLGKRYRLGERKPYFRLTEALESAVTAPIRGIRRAVASRGPRNPSDHDTASAPSATADAAHRVDANAHLEDEAFWALRNVSFEVEQGEVLGIIGRNGAGKSTLLKLIARITDPTEGCIRVRGRVASLLEVGTGFHPELTGRENVFLNGTILGMTHREVKAKFDEIVAFSGVEAFLDTPVKRYSSGMRVRLAFAVAAHLEPEILLIDEVLAVGDAEFQKKCLGKMNDVAKGGRTVLFVSHQMGAVQALCTRGLLFRDGAAYLYDEVAEAVANYAAPTSHRGGRDLTTVPRRSGAGQCRFERVDFLDNRGIPRDRVLGGASTTIRLWLSNRSGEPMQNTRIAIAISKAVGDDLSILSNEVTATPLHFGERGCVDCVIDRLPLSEGDYPLVLFLEVAGVVQDRIDHEVVLPVVGGDFFGCGNSVPRTARGRKLVLIDQRWEPRTP